MLRLSPRNKLRLSRVAGCFSGCFFGLELEGDCGLRLCYGRIATFNVDAMLALLSDMGGLWAASFPGGRFVLLGFRLSSLVSLSFCMRQGDFVFRRLSVGPALSKSHVQACFACGFRDEPFSFAFTLTLNTATATAAIAKPATAS